MIENDREFREAIREYVKTKNIESSDDPFFVCGKLACKDCILKDANNELYNYFGLSFCDHSPFQQIKECEKKIEILKKEISIMSNWKSKWERKHKINKQLKEFCKAFRSGNNDLSELTCYGIDCKSCPFKNMDNFKEWVRQAKMKGEVKRNDEIS